MSFIIPLAIVQIAKYKIGAGQKVQLEDLDFRSPLQINKAWNNLVTGLAYDINIAKR